MPRKINLSEASQILALKTDVRDFGDRCMVL